MENKEIANRFKIRCSAIGKIMTNGRAKDSMGKTAESYCLDWIREQPEFYGRRKEFSNKYTEKGNLVENDSIDFVSTSLYDGMMLIKNEEHFENEFITGTPDVILPDAIIDVKNSFDPFTFPLFESGLPSTDYWWQGQGYMKLVGRESYRVIYTLMDTPLNIIEREAYYHCKNNEIEFDEDIMNEFVLKMTYPDVDPSKRIKAFDFEFESGAIDQIEARVLACREFIFNTLESL